MGRGSLICYGGGDEFVFMYIELKVKVGYLNGLWDQDVGEREELCKFEGEVVIRKGGYVLNVMGVRLNEDRLEIIKCGNWDVVGDFFIVNERIEIEKRF